MFEKKEAVHIIVPKEVFGISVETIAIPVFVDDKIEGTLVISMSVDKTVKREKINNLANNVSESLIQMSTRIINMTSTFQEINETNSSIEKFIEETKESSKKTDEVLNFIEGITKQTNLLGLNAAIESSRAGEYGKGFSVVSNEIRSLSNSTKESIKQINATLNNIQSSINEIFNRFQNSNKLLDNQTTVIEEISANIQQLSATSIILKEFADEI